MTADCLQFFGVWEKCFRTVTVNKSYLYRARLAGCNI